MLERLEQLEENIALRKRMRREYTLEDLRNNRFDEWALRYGLFESIQIVIDLACHLSARYNLGAAKSYVECFERLHQYDYIDGALTRKMIAMVGLRNLLIHEYVRIELEKLYSYLVLVDDFSAFLGAVRKKV